VLVGVGDGKPEVCVTVGVTVFVGVTDGVTVEVGVTEGVGAFGVLEGVGVGY